LIIRFLSKIDLRPEGLATAMPGKYFARQVKLFLLTICYREIFSLIDKIELGGRKLNYVNYT